MKDYQQRVIDEQKELRIKIDKLQNFFDLDTFKNLDGQEKDRLQRQYLAMQDYSQILNERIVAFN